MPLYHYKCKVDGLGCSDCIPGKPIFQLLAEKTLTHCPDCEAPVYRAIQPGVGVKIKYAGPKGTGHDYRDDLAAFVGDPDAFIDGPRALSKLKDKRKRQGWSFKKIDMVSSRGAPKGSMAAEAYRRAKNKGFIPDSETQK